ncbi:MAG: hypothetical protein P1U89_20795 [Verrucomicrobiales bacterium]|nr:hypothetical protein [Verrucomicrobiales bacterium]
MKLTNPTEHTMNDMKLYVALDVHKDSIQCGIAHPGRSKPEVYAKWGGSNLCVERGLCKLLKKHDLTKDEVAICYEAGPTGFVLARRLHQLKYHCIVIAPSKIPQKSGDREFRGQTKYVRAQSSADLNLNCCLQAYPCRRFTDFGKGGKTQSIKQKRIRFPTICLSPAYWPALQRQCRFEMGHRLRESGPDEGASFC